METADETTVSMTSRQGRDKQRYHICPTTGTKSRMVVGTVPYRCDGLPSSLKVLLVNSRKYPEEWLLPKGGFEIDESLQDCALRETWEESGCIGRLAGALLVTNEAVVGGREQQVHFYHALEVSELKEEFPEMHERGRRFFAVDEARQVLSSQTRRKDRFVMLKALNKLVDNILNPCYSNEFAL